MTRAKYEVEDGQVLLHVGWHVAGACPQETDRFRHYPLFGQYFDLTRVKMQVGDNGQAAYEEFEQRKREEEREVIEQIDMEAELDAEDEEEGAVRRRLGMISRNRRFRFRKSRRREENYDSGDHLRIGS